MRNLFIASVLWLFATAVMADQAQQSSISHYLGDESGAFAMSRKIQEAAQKKPARQEAAKQEAAREEAAEPQRPVVDAEPDVAVEPQSQPVAATPKPEVFPDLGQPFDSSVDRLAVPVNGNDIKQLYARLVSINSKLEKKQEESLEQYRARISGIDPCRLGTDIRCDSKLAFYERVVMNGQYDVDSGTMEITFYLNDESLYSMSRRSPGRYAVIEIANNIVSERNYVRRVLGPSSSVLRTKGETWALSVWVDDLAAIISKATEQYYVCSMKIRMPAEWVQEFTDNIFRDVGLLYVGTLDSDPVYEDRDYGSAMMGIPYAKDVRRYSIKFKLDEIWVVNRATGRIYGKYIL